VSESARDASYPPPGAEPPPVFELSGGAPCLDFANTWGDRRRPASDRLHGYAELLAFARQANVLPAATLDAVAAGAAAHPRAADAAFAAARETRETLYRLFSDAARHRPRAAGDLAALNDQLAEALPHLRLAPCGEGYEWTWSDDAGLLAPLRPILRSAADLLAAPELARVRECDGATCTWLFLDRSRNRSRRWCDMESCGNRAKAARHYHRRREAG
jgi:predicted RNA-binding Zn ribbon-like protein